MFTWYCPKLSKNLKGKEIEFFQIRSVCFFQLLDENDYNVCLTLKCARDLYWAKVTLSDADFVLYYKKPRERKEVNGKKNGGMMNPGIPMGIPISFLLRQFFSFFYIVGISEMMNEIWHK